MTTAPINLGLASDLDLRVGDVVTIKVSQFLARQKDLAARVLDGEIVAVTRKALRFHGTASVRVSAWCHRCGQAIKHPRSLRVGYGPVCSEWLGIDWDADISDEALQAIAEAAASKTEISEWFPRSSTSILSQEHVGPATLDQQLAALVTAKAGLSPQDDDTAAIIKCHAYISRHFGDWGTLGDAQKQAVLDHLAGVAPKAATRPAAQVRAWTAGGATFVRSPYSPDNVQVCRSIPLGRWDAAEKAWYYPATSAHARLVADAWHRAGLSFCGDAEFGRLIEEGLASASPAVPALVADSSEYEEI